MQKFTDFDIIQYVNILFYFLMSLWYHSSIDNESITNYMEVLLKI